MKSVSDSELRRALLGSETILQMKSYSRFTIIAPPLYKLWQLLGMMPLNIGRRSSRKRNQNTAVRMIILPVLWLIVTGILFSSDIYLRLKLSSPSAVATASDLFTKYMSWARILFFHNRCIMQKYEPLLGFLNSLKIADSLLPTNKTDKMRIISVIITLLTAIYIIVPYTVGDEYFRIYQGFDEVIKRTVYLFIVCLGAALCTHFICLMLELWVRLRFVNYAVTRIVLMEPKEDYKTRELRRTPQWEEKKLRQIRLAHLSLQRAAEFLQDHMGFTMVLELPVSMCGIVYSAFELKAQRGAADSYVVPNRSAYMAALWLVNHLLRFCAMVLAADAVTEESRRTGSLLNRAVALRSTGDVSPELLEFWRQVTMAPATQFTAAGFVALDRRLLTSAVATVLTYLVVVGQTNVE